MHQRRLREDENGALAVYERHCQKVDDVVDENYELKAKVEAFEDRFASELEKEPLRLLRDPQAHKSFEEAVGPEFIAQTISLFKGFEGINYPERTCETERVRGIYGFGPAGPPAERATVEMPEGYLERKAFREALVEEGDEGEEDWRDLEEPVMEQV